MTDIFSLAWLIPLLPFAAFAIVGIFLQRQHELSSWLVILATAASCAVPSMPGCCRWSTW